MKKYVLLTITILLAITVTAKVLSPQSHKPQMSDTIKAVIYADNWFSLHINGQLVAVDSIKFLPHNVVQIDLLPSYPMTIAVMATDNADPKTGMEYANTQIGDAGFILRFADGTVTDQTWKAHCVSRGPIDGDTKNPRVETTEVPEGWTQPDFDDSAWPTATVFDQDTVDPKATFFDFNFGNAKFIWSSDLAIDNIVLFRKTVATPPDGVQRPDFTNLNNTVPDAGPPKKRNTR